METGRSKLGKPELASYSMLTLKQAYTGTDTSQAMCKGAPEKCPINWDGFVPQQEGVYCYKRWDKFTVHT